MAIIRDRDLIEDLDNIPVELIKNCIDEHQKDIARLNKLDNYYLGKHKILDRKFSEELMLPNNKIVANHAKYITDIIVGYFTGNPVKYEGDIDPITDAYKKIDIISHDVELEKDLSVFGRGLELHFVSSDEVPIPKVSVIDPRKIFLVVDDTVEYNSLFGVHYYEKRDIKNDVIGYNVNVYTANKVTQYFTKDLALVEDYLVSDVRDHYYDGVPIIEYWNNEEQQGDFEQQISLIDAYNTLQSDRVNDKEQLVDAILAISGFSLGDDVEEATQTVKLLKELKVLEMPDIGAKAEWLVKQLTESEVEVLKESIKNDIHEFSMVPNLTDEHFASNASGIAMKYKLFGLEQLVKGKERYFVQGLRERLKLFANFLHVKGHNLDVAEVEIKMLRNLPEDDLTIQELVSLGIQVSNETLLGQVPFVDDPEEEDKKVNEQKAEEIKRNQVAFGMPFDHDEDVDDEEEDG